VERVERVESTNDKSTNKCCSRRKCYAPVLGFKAQRCSLHRRPTDVNVTVNRCEHPKCTVQAVFNKPHLKSGRWCKQHKAKDDVDVRTKKCEFKGCTVQPVFSAEGSKVKKRCKLHKLEGDVDVANAKCERLGCLTFPVFNSVGSTGGKRCKLHKEPLDVDVRTKKCEYRGCDTVPFFNARGSKRGARCKAHKLKTDIDVKNARCEFAGCESIRPIFGAPGTTKGRWCKQHKSSTDVDVKNKRCEERGCESRVLYGLPGQIETRCAVHKLINQIKKPKRKCEEQACNEFALFGAGAFPERCATHCKPTDRDLVQRACKSCGLIDLVGQQGVCGDCDPAVFARVKLRKQREVRAALMESSLPAFETYDKVLQAGACGKERPDFSWPCGVVLEVDEHQHKSYACDERIRMVNVTSAMGQPTLFVRYNPDEYSGWRSSSMRSKERLAYLVGFLKSQVCGAPQQESRVVKLFYDGFTGEPEFTQLQI